MHKVPGVVDKARIQEYGVNIFTFCPTKSALKKALKKKLIKVNGEIASTATIIKGGEIIELSVRVSPFPLHQLKLHLDVPYQDDYLAVVYKPSGLLTSGNKRRTLKNTLAFNLKPSTQVDATHPQPAHRLDYETSGLVLVGKTQGSIRLLNTQFKEKAVKKVYYAIAIGSMSESGEIDYSIAGKQAVSSYTVLKRTPSDRFECLNLVKLIPHTGRQNQLRIHLKALGNPILGDKKFGTEGLILTGKGLYLHASSLQFRHPFTGNPKHIECPLPKKFLKIFKSANLPD